MEHQQLVKRKRVESPEESSEAGECKESSDSEQSSQVGVCIPQGE